MIVSQFVFQRLTGWRCGEAAVLSTHLVSCHTDRRLVCQSAHTVFLRGVLPAHGALLAYQEKTKYHLYCSLATGARIEKYRDVPWDTWVIYQTWLFRIINLFVWGKLSRSTSIPTFIKTVFTNSTIAFPLLIYKTEYLIRNSRTYERDKE